MTFGRFVIIFLVLLLSACAPFSDDVMRRVDTDVQFIDVRKSPERYESKTILWGGVIIETANRPDETAIKVMKTALDIEKRPTEIDSSEGRFIVLYSGFLDPAIYEKGRELTVVGTISGREIHPLGHIQYLYPVVKAKELRLWGKKIPYRPLYDPFWPHAPFWWHRYPYWPYYPY